MTKSNSAKTYPARLYEEGKRPLQHRRMNHNCHLAGLQMVEEAVGFDAWESIKTASVGVIVKLKELDYAWSAKAIHHLLTNQLVVNNIHEIWSAIEGNSTVKSIITGVSKAHYDPLAKVDETKFKKLLDYLRSISDDNDVDTHFYMKLITPRNDWETDEFGWLADSHMASAMLMLHKRSMRDPSPYSSSRIAFLEHWFVKMWVRDYKKYDPKTWTKQP